MRPLISVLTLSALLAGIAFTPARAGGMGDTAAHIRELNALCDQQRRGEIARYPDLCLPELPPGPVYQEPQRR